jgi:hypothetical protein
MVTFFFYDFRKLKLPWNKKNTYFLDRWNSNTGKTNSMNFSLKRGFSLKPGFYKNAFLFFDKKKKFL